MRRGPRSPSGLSCWAFALTWDVYLLARLVTSADGEWYNFRCPAYSHVRKLKGSALATVLTTISVRLYIRALYNVKFTRITAGRIRKGPAPLNLEIPEYEVNDAEGKMIIG